MSQIPRYLYGSTNLSLLQSQRSSAITPAEGAAAAAAPYEAVSDAAKNISADLAAVQEYKDKVQDKEDTMASALNMSNYKNTTEANKKQAIAENWTPEQFEANQGAIDKAFMGSAELISERNRPLITRTYQSAMSGVQLETAITSSEIKRNIQGQEYEAQRAESVQNKTYETTMFLDDMARQSGLIEEAEYIKLSALTEGQITAEGWMNKYKDAVATGTEDDLLLKMSEADLTDETWAFFGQDQAQYDAATQAIANDIRVARQINYNDFLDTLKPGVDTNTVDSYINDNKWLTGGQINTLRNTLRGAEEDEAFLMGMHVDNRSPKRRGIVSDKVNLNQPPEDILRDSIAITSVLQTSPDILTNMANRYSDSPAQGALSTIGNAMLGYYTNPDTKGVPMPMSDRARVRIEMYMDYKRGEVPDADAEAAVNAITADDSEETIQARKLAWDDERFGTDSGKTPREYVKDEIERRLTDVSTDLGKTFLADLGKYSWFLGVGRDQYGDASVSMSPLMQREITRNAENFWQASESEEVAISAPLNSIRARGAAATDINYDIPFNSVGGTRKYQIQINPITKSANGGVILSQEEVRATIGKDLAGLSLHPQFSAAGYEKEFSMDEIEIGDGVIATEGENAGNLQWPLKNMGGILTVPSGEFKNQPVYFYWKIPPTVLEEPQINKDAAAIANKIEEQNKPVTEKNDRLEP